MSLYASASSQPAKTSDFDPYIISRPSVTATTTMIVNAQNDANTIAIIFGILATVLTFATLVVAIVTIRKTKKKSRLILQQTDIELRSTPLE